MKKILLSGLVFLIFMSSCVNTKKISNYWIYKNQNIYKNEDIKGVTHIKVYNIRDGIPAQIKEENGEIQISNFNEIELLLVIDTIVPKAIGSKTSYHYPSIITKRDTLCFRKDFVKDNKPFRYLEISPITQASTIPFKYRPKQDTLNYTVSTSGNLGFVYGLKFSNHKFRNIYNTNGKRFNAYTTNFSITPGVFCGPTTVDLTLMNTENKIKNNITVLGLNSGFLFVLGVNKFNIGGAVGFDYALGNDGNHWVYNGKPWYGFVLSLDFVK